MKECSYCISGVNQFRLSSPQLFMRASMEDPIHLTVTYAINLI